jgi:hypothetical protein
MANAGDEVVMVYWIRDFEHSATNERFRVYSDSQYIPALRRRVAKHSGDEEWLDDQLYRHDASLDVRLEGDHPLHIEGLRFGEMPLKTADQIERECLRLLRVNASIRDVQRVTIVRIEATGTEPNWTYSSTYPELTAIGRSEADEIVASAAARWALVA